MSIDDGAHITQTPHMCCNMKSSRLNSASSSTEASRGGVQRSTPLGSAPWLGHGDKLSSSLGPLVSETSLLSSSRVLSSPAASALLLAALADGACTASYTPVQSEGSSTSWPGSAACHSSPLQRRVRSQLRILFLPSHLCQDCSVELHPPAQQGACMLLALKRLMWLVPGLAAVLEARGHINGDLLTCNAACK